MKAMLQALSVGLVSFALAACGSVNLDNGTINPGTTPTVKDPNITSVTVNGNQLLGRTTDVWISGDANVFVKATSNVGLDSIDYSIADQVGTIDKPKASNLFRISNLTAGSHTLTITATNLKNAETTLNLPVKVDLTGPTVTVTSPPEAGGGTIPKVSGIVELKVAVADAESGVQNVKFIQKGETDQQVTNVTRNNNEYSIQVDTTKLTEGVKYYEVQVTNKAGLVSSKVVGLNVNNTGGNTEPTAPVVRLRLAPGDKSGTITVPFFVTSEDPLKNAKLLVDGEAFKNMTSPPAETELAFTLDVSQLPLGTHQVTVSAETVNNKADTSDPVSINVTANLNLPLFKISAPQAGAKLGGKAPVEISVVKRGSDFVFTSDITVEIVGFGGQLVKTLTIPKAGLKAGDGIYTTALVDWPRLTGADNYDVRAYATIQVEDGNPNQANPTFNMQDQLTTGVSISNVKPPAANIIIPSRNDATSAVPSAIINRSSGILLQMTDEAMGRNLEGFRVDIRLVTKNPDGSSKITKYLYNLPLSSNVLYYSIPELILDGSEYVEDGEYTLQTITEDNEGNGNVQEVAITVDRNADSPANMLPNAAVRTVLVNAPYAKGKPDKHSATWQLCKNPNTVDSIEYFLGNTAPTPTETCDPVEFTNRTTIGVTLVRNGTTVVSRSFLFSYRGDAPAYSYSFSAAGEYQPFFYVQDLITGVTQVFAGETVGVTIYE